MKKEFILYNEALALKELGFDEPCIGWYSNMEGNVFRQGYCETYLGIENCAKAPLYQQAFRWFREKYGIFSCIMTEYSYGGYISTYHINGKHQLNISKGDYTTHEEAELECLKKLIEIVKNK